MTFDILTAGLMLIAIFSLAGVVLGWLIIFRQIKPWKNQLFNYCIGLFLGLYGMMALIGSLHLLL